MNKFKCVFLYTFFSYFVLIQCYTESCTEYCPLERSARTVRIAVLAPDTDELYALHKILPIIKLAVDKVTDRKEGVLPGYKMEIYAKDSNCSSLHGPLAAFQFHIKDTAGRPEHPPKTRFHCVLISKKSEFFPKDKKTTTYLS